MGWLAKLLVGLGVAVAFLLVFGFVVALTLYDNAKPYIEREYPTVLYEREDPCDPCTTNGATERWSVPAGANEVKFFLNATIRTPSGPAHIVVTDPSGDVLFDRIITSDTQESASWAPEEGEWTIARTYGGVRGEIEILVLSQGIPPGSLP